MKLKTLPSTSLNVSQVCLGTMTWGEQNSESEAHAQLDYAIAQGINFIDTAEMYPVPPNGKTQGRTESFLGSWLKRQPRDKLIVATKIAGPGRRDWIRSGRTDLTREVIAEAVDTSLQRLQTDYIDLYQIHWPQRNVPMFGATEFDPAKEKKDGPSIHEQVEGMAAMLKAGKIRYYGLSNETAWGVSEFRRAAKELGVPGPVTIQNSYSLVSRNVDNDLAETLFRENMSLLAYSPLAAGILSGKISERRAAAEARASPCSIRSVRVFANQWSARRWRRMLRSLSNAASRRCNWRSATSRAAGLSARQSSARRRCRNLRRISPRRSWCLKPTR